MPFPNGTVKRKLSRDLGSHITIRDFGPHDYKSTDTDEYPIGNNAGLMLGDAFGGSLSMALARYTPADLGVTATLDDTVDWAAAQLMARKCKHGHIQAGMQCKFSQQLALGSNFTLEGEQSAELISNVDLGQIITVSPGSSYVTCKKLLLTGPGGPPTDTFGPDGIGVWVQDGCAHVYLDDLECRNYQQSGIFADIVDHLYIDRGYFHDGWTTLTGPLAGGGNDNRSGADILVRRSVTNSSFTRCRMLTDNDFGVKILLALGHGTCTTAGTRVDRVDGYPFTPEMAIFGPKHITIGSTQYDIAAFVNSDQLTLATSAGTQSIPVSFAATYMFNAHGILVDDCRIENKHYYGIVRYAAYGGIYDCTTTRCRIMNISSRSPTGVAGSFEYGSGVYDANYLRDSLTAECILIKCAKDNDGTSIGKGSIGAINVNGGISFIENSIKDSYLYGYDIRSGLTPGFGPRIIGGTIQGCASYSIFANTVPDLIVRSVKMFGGLGTSFLNCPGMSFEDFSSYQPTGIGCYVSNSSGIKLEGTIDQAGAQGFLLDGSMSHVDADLVARNCGLSAPGTLEGVTAQGSGGAHWRVRVRSYNDPTLVNSVIAQGYGARFFAGIGDFQFDKFGSLCYGNAIADYVNPLFVENAPESAVIDHYTLSSPDGVHFTIRKNQGPVTLTTMASATQQSVNLFSIDPGTAMGFGVLIYQTTQWSGTGITSLSLQMRNGISGDLYTAPFDMLSAVSPSSVLEDSMSVSGYHGLAQIDLQITANTNMSGTGMEGTTEIYLFNGQFK